MAKMNTRGASPSRLVPPGSCSQNAKTPGIPENMISTAKLILCSEIPYSNRDRRNRPSSLAERNSAQVCFLRRLNAGILFSYGRRSCSLQARTGDAAPRFRSERHGKERTLSPSQIECRTAAQGVKDTTPNLQKGTLGAPLIEFVAMSGIPSSVRPVSKPAPSAS